MKNIITIFVLIYGLCIDNLFSQNQNYLFKDSQTTFSANLKISPFSISSSNSLSFLSLFKDGYTPTILNINQTEVAKIKKSDVFLELTIPANSKSNLILELVQVDFFGPDFKVIDGKGNSIAFEKGLYYHGRIKGDNNSMVALSISKSEITGLITDKNGSRSLGKIKDQSQYSLSYDNQFKEQKHFNCSVVDSNATTIPLDQLQPQSVVGCKAVGMYIETDYSIFQNLSNSAQEAATWATTLFNQVALLYRNDNIGVYMSQMKVWTTPDPYISATTTAAFVTTFHNNVYTNYTGNLAQVFSMRYLGGGIAYDIGGICNKPNSQSVSASLSQYYNSLPYYSWNVNVVTHEFGHSFGSRHTHACVWNGNGTAIDGCGPTYTTNESGNLIPYEGNCCCAPIPSTGTIMSYCHWAPGGINLLNGFGPQPGNLIRNNVSSCSQISSPVIPITGTTTNFTGVQTAQLAWNQHPTATNYFVAYWSDIDNIQHTTPLSTNPFANLSNLYSGANYTWFVNGDCYGASSYANYSYFTTQVNLNLSINSTNLQLCPGVNTLSFTQTGVTNINNEFNVEISDINGVFNGNHTKLLSAAINGNLSFNIPYFLSPGIGYKLRISSTSPKVFSNVINLTLKPAPAFPQVSISNSSFFCNNNPISVSVNNCNGTVSWSGGYVGTGNSFSIVPIEGTTFTATCVASNGCGNSKQSESLVRIAPGTKNSKVLWEKSFGGAAGDSFGDIIKTADGGYLAIDISYSDISGNKTQAHRGQGDGLIVKFDVNGNIVWEKVYGGSGYDVLVRIKVLSDGNFMVLGRSTTGIEYEKTSPNKGNIDFWLLKIDPNGNIIWDKTYGANSIDYGNDFMTTPDGGIILVGTVFMDATMIAANGDRGQNGKGDHDAWVIKIDANGNKVWDKIFGGSGTESANKIVKAVDNSGYYIFGLTSTTNIAGSDLSAPARNGYDAWLFKFDENGNKIFDKVYSGGNTFSGTSSTEDIYEMGVLPDGNYLLVAHSNNNSGNEKSENSMGDDDLWLIKISPNGTIIKDKTIGGDGQDKAGSFYVRSDGSILFCGITGSNQNVDKKDALKGNMDALILNLDANLNMIWSEKIGGAIITPSISVEGFSRMIYEGNDIFTFVGSSSESKGDRAESFGGVDGWIVKMKIPLTTKPTISSPSTLACVGESITLNVSGCTSDILWSNGLTSASIVVKPNSNENVYTVNCRTDANNCISMQSDVYRPVLADNNQILSGTATSGVVQAKQTITSRQTIQPNTNVSYRAGKSILLEKNQSFEAKAGSIFKAEIASCAIENGLLARYDFSNNVLDQSGNNRNGLANTALFTKDRFGNSNSALSFNGVNQYVTLGNWFNYQEFTISFWVNAGATQTNDYAELIDNNHTQFRSWFAQQDNTSNNLYYFGAYGSPRGDVFFNLTSTWNHLTFVKGAGLVKVFLNGKLVNTATHGGTITYDGTQNLILGAWYASGGFARFWKGSMDDLKLYNRALSDTEITTIFQAEAPNPSLSAGLFANYKFDGNANDVSGKGNNGTINGSATFTTDRFGQANKALNFDGVDDHVSVPNNNTLSGFNEITLSAWVNHNQTTGTLGAIIAKWYQSVQDNYLMVVEGGTNKFGASTNNERNVPFYSPNSIPINTWNHLVFTHNSSGDWLYFNGYLVASNTISGNIIYSSQNLLIGADSNLGTLWRFFKGKIDDVRLYNRALSRLEVQQLYDLEKP